MVRCASIFLISVFVVGSHAQSRTPSKQSAGQVNDVPQRTIFTTPAGVHADREPAPASAAPDGADNALEKYREMWRKMTPAQQKAFVDSGGYTPEQYERLLKQKGSGAPVDPGRKIDPAMDSLNKSIQNLDTIRDANLGRVQAENCPPEVAARIADLKAKLQAYESEPSGVPAPIAARPREAGNPVDPLAIAADWYKPGSGIPPATRASQQSKLLADVLPSAEALPARTQAHELEIARTRTELEQLSGACGAAAR
jgi:hypothetical protein